MRKVVKSFRNFQIWDINTWINERLANPSDPEGILRIFLRGYVHQPSNTFSFQKFKEEEDNSKYDFTQFDWNTFPDSPYRREVTWYSGEILVLEFELFD